MKNFYLLIASKKYEIEYMYGELSNDENCQIVYLEHILQNKILWRIFSRIFNSSKIDLIIPKRFKYLLRKFIQNKYTNYCSSYFSKQITISNEKKSNTKICFIVMARIYEEFGDTITKYLRKNYPNAICTSYFVDVVSSFKCPVSDYYSSFDKIYSFDKTECNKYGFTYCLEPFAYHQIPSSVKNPEYDVTFIGAAKDRLNDILSVYEKLKAHNLKLDFWIFGVKEENQKYKDEIHYNSYLSFDEFINHTLNARCTFETLQKNGSSPTTRFSMCMLYKRKLLTNCIELLDSEWSETMATDNIQVYKDMNSIDFDWIKKDCEYDNQKYVEMFSTRKMIEKMDSVL